MRTILWDLDGTLADTEELHFAAWQQIMRVYGVKYDYPTFLADFGRNNREILVNLLGPSATPALIVEISQRKERDFRALLPQHTVPLLPGVADWLAHFQKEGVQQVVSSSGPMANIAALVAKLEIGDYFMSLMSGYRLPRGKPHPAIFLNSAAAVGVTPLDCIVIEDSLAGTEAARRAGMACVAVGKVTSGAALHDLLDAIHGQPYLAVENLAQVSWTQFEQLWDGARDMIQPSIAGG